MPHSYAETLTLTCAACGRDFDAELWLIIDVAERPDLIERIRAGDLHELTCPHCGDAGHMDAPLLLFNPPAQAGLRTVPLLFSPAEETTADEDREQARQLVELLQEALADDWQDDWLAEGLRSAPRALLPTLLSDDPESAVAEMAERAAAERARLQEEDPQRQSLDPEQLLRAFELVVNARTWTESQRIVEQSPVLLHPDADDILRKLAAVQPDPQTRHVVEQHRTLLRRCQEVGVEQAFAEKTGGSAGQGAEPLTESDPAALAQAVLNQAVTGQQIALSPEQLTPSLVAAMEDLAAQKEGQRADAARQLAMALRQALAGGATGGPSVPPQFQADAQQAQQAEQRYLRTGDRSALDTAATAWLRIIDDPAFAYSDQHFRLTTMNSAGGVFLRRYWSASQLPDLNHALALWQTAVQRTLPDSPDLPGYLNNLGIGLSARYARTGALADREEAIASFETAVQRTPPDSPDLPSRLNNLGNSLRARYARTGALADLEEAISSFETAVQRTPPGSPDLPGYLNNLGIGLRARYARTGSLADLEEAIHVCQTAVQRTPPNSPDLPSLLNNLGNGLRDRYARTGALADLEEAIASFDTAVQRTPPDSPGLPSLLNTLGAGLSDRYARTGSLADLEKAIRIKQTAVQRTPPDSPDLPSRLNNLGTGLRNRYTRTGALADLEEAIRVCQTAVQRTPPDSPDLPSRLNNLGNGLSDRYARTGSLADLEEAIRVKQTAVQRTPPGSPDVPSLLNNLGSGLRARYARTGALADLEEAIRVCQTAVQRTPPDSPDLPGNLNNLGVGLSDRYARTGSLADLEEAIRVKQTAVQRTPPDSPDLPRNLNNMGNGLRARYARTGSLADLEEARERYRVACRRGLEVTPEEALRSARNWGNWALERRDWQDATEAYDYSRRAIDRLFTIQTNRAAKESWLREAQGLPANAAYALARLGRLEEAVVALEIGRARLLAEALEQNRRDMEQLEPLGHKAVLNRYRAASQRVTALQQQASQPATQTLRDSPQSPDHPFTQFDYTAWRQQLEQARAELDAAIDAIRQVPGYQDFFLPPTFEKIRQTATPDAPLVYLAATPVGSAALVVRATQTLRVSANHDSQANGDSPANHDQTRRVSDEVSALWLDSFSEADLDALLVERQDGEVTGGYLPGQLGDYDALHASLAQLLPRLGQALLGSLAAHLHSLGVAGVVLVPAGRLSLLPLHAASYPVDGQERCFLDEFSVRYAPSAAALATAHGEAQRRHAPLRLAGVGNPLPDLATGAWASQRAQAILQRLPAAPADERLAAAHAVLQALAAAPPHDAIRAGAELIMAARDLALGGADRDLVLSTLEIAQRIPPSLDYAEAELHSVLDLLPGDGAWTAYGEQATRDALWQALPAATWLHLACHGQFNPQEPLDSALLLAAGSRITLNELLDRQQSAALAGLRLAFLSACQTAISDFNHVPDEAIGLPAAFLQAGIPAVVGTLWPVNDASTALLATRFYELHLHGDPAAGLAQQPPAASLQGAQRWLRDVTNAELDLYLDSHRRLKEASEQQQERMSWALIKETRRQVRRAVAAGQGDARPYAAAYHWAPFVFYGAG